MIITYKESISETVEKLRDINITTFNNESLANYYQTWVDQIASEKITDPKLANFIKLQIEYWRQKDRKYADYLEELLRK